MTHTVRSPLRRFVPSVFTLGNLLCGYLAIISLLGAAGPAYEVAAWWIIIAAIFDALDGKVARLTGTSSDFGIEFDSLADAVSFGIAPAVLMYRFVFADAGFAGHALTFVFLAAGVFRLARFNLTATIEKKHGFTGMPIPAGASLLAAFVLFSDNVWGRIGAVPFASVLVFVTAAAMMSSFRYSGLPRIGFTTPVETVKSVSFIGMILLLIMFPDELFLPVGITYLLSGPMGAIMAPAVNQVFHR